MSTFGFIGSGNMAGAIAVAVEKKLGGKDIYLFDIDTQKVNELAGKLNATVATNIAIAKNVDYLFLGVKPQMLDIVVDQIGDEIRARNGKMVVVSMLAGTDLAKLESRFGSDCKIIRILPNTPVAVSKGIVFYKANKNVTEEELNTFVDAMSVSGKISLVVSHQ